MKGQRKKDKENLVLLFENSKHNIRMNRGTNFSGINILLFHHDVLHRPAVAMMVTAKRS